MSNLTKSKPRVFTCPQCKGQKVIRGAFHDVQIDCMVCGSSGEIDSFQMLDFCRGRYLKELRLALGYTLREICNQKKWDMLAFSNASLGLNDPTMYIDALEREMCNQESMEHSETLSGTRDQYLATIKGFCLDMLDTEEDEYTPGVALMMMIIKMNEHPELANHTAIPVGQHIYNNGKTIPSYDDVRAWIESIN